MKDRFRILIALLFVCIISGLPAQAKQAIGKVERQKGLASRSAIGNTDELSQGSQIFVGDEIRTGPNARILIAFDDESKLTLGQNGRITIDDFVYVPNGKSRQALAILTGVFRFASGKIGKASPRDISLSTPVATIGIRGTVFLGGELTTGMPVGRSRYGFQINEGAIEVISLGGSVVLDEAGEGTFLPLSGVAEPTPVRQWSVAVIAEVESALEF